MLTVNKIWSTGVFITECQAVPWQKDAGLRASCFSVPVDGDLLIAVRGSDEKTCHISESHHELLLADRQACLVVLEMMGKQSDSFCALWERVHLPPEPTVSHCYPAALQEIRSQMRFWKTASVFPNTFPLFRLMIPQHPCPKMQINTTHKWNVDHVTHTHINFEKNYRNSY